MLNWRLNRISGFCRYVKEKRKREREGKRERDRGKEGESKEIRIGDPLALLSQTGGQHPTGRRGLGA